MGRVAWDDLGRYDLPVGVNIGVHSSSRTEGLSALLTGLKRRGVTLPPKITGWGSDRRTEPNLRRSFGCWEIESEYRTGNAFRVRVTEYGV